MNRNQARRQARATTGIGQHTFLDDDQWKTEGGDNLTPSPPLSVHRLLSSLEILSHPTLSSSN